MDDALFEFILNHQKVEYAIFDTEMGLTESSPGLSDYLSNQKPAIPGEKISELFAEMTGYEDSLLEVRDGNHPPIEIKRIEIIRQARQNLLPVYHNLHIHPYQGGLIAIIRDISEDGRVEQQVFQRRNELNLINIQLCDDLNLAYYELDLAYTTTLEGWARALELRDLETKGHSQRVVALTLKLADTMGVGIAEMKAYWYGSLLHDIGKVAIPDRILLKPAPLNEKEWEIMRLHPVYAYKLLASIKYLQGALDIPYFHHEKWDGSGYPQGLKGEEIPLQARIFSIVDVWDALTSDRPYRNAWSKKDTFEYIRQKIGILFDPEVGEKFLKIIEREI